MIIRIVKMSFNEDEIENFLQIFELQKTFIASFEGCSHLSLLKDKNAENVYFTYSYWEDEAALERYRNSEFFRNIWKEVKLKFNKEPEAWSLEKYA
jgi:autoinducer 2-degrading protein